MVWFILGLMAGSLYAIVMGPAGLDVPQSPVSVQTFDWLGFVLGVAVLLGWRLCADGRSIMATPYRRTERRRRYEL